MPSPTYIAIDLKSFYASVECVDRGLDPLTAHLVVADVSRTEKTICLAVSPALKSYGISGRARLFEVVKPVALSADELIDATRLQWDDNEDCLVMLAALKAHADYLITRDKKGFTRSAVPALTPQEWLALQAKRGISYTPAELPR